MKNLELTIEKIDNGFIITFSGGYEGGKEVIEITTNEDQDEEDEEKRAMTKLLERIAIFFGVMYDGFSEKNLNILWNKKGDEVE